MKSISNKMYLFDGIQNYLGSHSNKMRLKAISLGIVLDTAFFIPPRTGVGYRLYYLSKTLAEHGLTIKLFLCNRNFESDESVEGLRNVNHFEIHLIPASTFYDPKRMTAIIASAKPLLLQFEDSETALMLGPTLKQELGLPLCLEIHDVMTSLKASFGFGKDEIDLSEFTHYASCQLVDLVICMTEENLKELVFGIGVDASKIHCAPNGIDLSTFRFLGPNTTQKNVIFVGNLFYQPNADAVRIIARSILPQLWQDHSDVRFSVIGMGHEALQKKYKDITFTGFVDDLNSELRKATIAIAPILKGSGMKTKLLNYAAAGLPIVTTPEGAKGYEGMPGLVVEDNVEKFAKHIENLLTAPERMIEMGRENRAFLESNLDWNSIAGPLIRQYQRCEERFEFANDVNQYHLTAQPLPKPFWLKEKRVIPNANQAYYKISKGQILKSIV